MIYVKQITKRSYINFAVEADNEEEADNKIREYCDRSRMEIAIKFTDHANVDDPFLLMSYTDWDDYKRRVNGVGDIRIRKPPVETKKRNRVYCLMFKDHGANVDIDHGKIFDSMNELYDYISENYIKNGKFRRCVIRDITVVRQDDGIAKFTVPVTGYNN